MVSNKNQRIGFLAEILLTLFFIIKDPHKQLKKLELGIAFIKNPETINMLQKQVNILNAIIFVIQK